MSARAYARQARLAEVGVEGQARIEAAHVRIEGDAAARELAEAYLVRAGVGAASDARDEVEVASFVVQIASFDHAGGLSQGPAAIGNGALAALVALRAVLGLGAPEDRLRATETDATRHV